MSVRREIASYCVGATFDKLPGDIVQHTRYCLMDHVATNLVGLRIYSEDNPDVAGFMVDLGGKEESTIIGEHVKVPCLNAVLVNSIRGNINSGLEAIHKKSKVHAYSTLFPATLSVSERQKSTGKELIAALVTGTDIYTRVSYALGESRHLFLRGFHPTSLCAPFGSVVAAGKLLGLTPDQMADALSIAAVQASGSAIWTGAIYPGSWLFPIARAAQSGVMAAMMAQIGLTGIENIFEDKRGFLASHSDSFDAAKLTEGLGKRYEIKGLILKRFAFGNLVQTSVEGIHNMLEQHKISGDDIKEISVELPTPSVASVGSPEYPENRMAAVVNVRYALAVNAYMGRQAVYSTQLSSAESRKDPRVKDLFKRINVITSPGLDADFAAKEPCILDIKLKDGRQFRQRNDGPGKGDPDNPLSKEEIEAKFHLLTAPILGKTKAAEIADIIKHLDELNDVSKLVNLMTGAV